MYARSALLMPSVFDPEFSAAMEHPASLRERLPAALQASLREDVQSPLQQWLNGHCYDGVALVRYASTFGDNEGWPIIVAAAAACLLDCAREHHPIDMYYVRPIWRSITEGQVAAEYLTSNTDTRPGIDPPAPLHTIDDLNVHTALGLARMKALDAATREHLMQRSIDHRDVTSTALAWFSLDIEMQEAPAIGAIARRYLSRWMHANPNDPDLPFVRLRDYLESARRIGSLGALTPLLRQEDMALSVQDAAWTVAWDDAIRRGAHHLCADLAIERAIRMQKHTNVYRRWVLLYGFHRERVEDYHVSEFPVRRELLEMIYTMDEPHTAAALAVGIAARTTRLEPVLRETLPFMQGPTIPLLRASFGVGCAIDSLEPLADLGVAGTLLALRLQQRFQNAPAIDHPRSVRQKTPPPTPIFDEDASENHFGEGEFSFERDADDTTAAAARSAQRAPTRELRTTEDNDTTAASASSEHPPQSAASARPTGAANVPPNAREGTDTSAAHNDASNAHGSVDPAIFAILPSIYQNQDDAPLPPNAPTPGVSDVLLAAFLPDDVRERADRMLAQRITQEGAAEHAFARAIEERIDLLPLSGWRLAELTTQNGDPYQAKKWMRRVADSTVLNELKAQRFRALARHCAQECQDLTQAITYLQQSLQSVPTDPGAIELLDSIYTRSGRHNALAPMYQDALTAALKADIGDATIQKWRRRLREVDTQHKPRT